MHLVSSLLSLSPQKNSSLPQEAEVRDMQTIVGPKNSALFIVKESIQIHKNIRVDSDQVGKGWRE